MVRGLQFAVLLMATVTSVWVFFDAKSRGMWPWVWFLLSLGMWIFGFPAYLLRRYQLKLRSQRLGTPPFVPDYKNDLYHMFDRVAVALVAGLMFASVWYLSGLRSASRVQNPPSYIQYQHSK
jgi:hypothetical protein